MLRQVLDEMRSEFQWAIQNGRIHVQLEHADVSNDSTRSASEGDSIVSLEAKSEQAAPQQDGPAPGKLF